MHLCYATTYGMQHAQMAALCGRRAMQDAENNTFQFGATLPSPEASITRV